MKYLRILNFECNIQGVVKNFQKETIFLDDKVPLMNAMPISVETILKKNNNNKADEKILGRSVITLSGSCKMSECSLGNMVTDAMCYYSTKKRKTGNTWTRYPIAIVCGEFFRTDMPTRITRTSIRTALQHDRVSFLTITGEQLEHLLIKKMKLGNLTQISGVHFYYCRDEGDVRTFVTVRCTRCREPMYKRLEHRKTYRVMMNYNLAYIYFYGKHENKGPAIQGNLTLQQPISG